MTLAGNHFDFGVVEKQEGCVFGSHTFTHDLASSMLDTDPVLPPSCSYQSSVNGIGFWIAIILMSVCNSGHKRKDLTRRGPYPQIFIDLCFIREENHQ